MKILFTKEESLIGWGYPEKVLDNSVFDEMPNLIYIMGFIQDEGQDGWLTRTRGWPEAQQTLKKLETHRGDEPPRGYWFVFATEPNTWEYDDAPPPPPPPPPPPETGSINGTVTTKTGEPIESAKVETTLGQQTSTSRDGSYEITDIPPDVEFKVRAVKEGFQTKELS